MTMRLFTAACAALALTGFAAASLAQTPATTPGATPGATPGTAAPATRPAATPPAAAARPAAAPARPAALAAGHYRTEAEAKAHCPTDTVVWANDDSKIFHLTGTRFYGKTKEGAYMCRKEAEAGGFRVSGQGNAATPAAPAATTTPAAATPATTTPARR